MDFRSFQLTESSTCFDYFQWAHFPPFPYKGDEGYSKQEKNILTEDPEVKTSRSSIFEQFFLNSCNHAAQVMRPAARHGQD